MLLLLLLLGLGLLALGGTARFDVGWAVRGWLWPACEECEEERDNGKRSSRFREISERQGV